MSLPLDLAYYELNRARRLKEVPGHMCRDDMIYLYNYRTAFYYKRIGNDYIFTRKLLPREIEDMRFENGKSFYNCTICERLK